MSKYRQSGGAADLVRVEVLVPPSQRGAILSEASRLRANHRARKERLEALCSRALDRYAARLLDNLDLERLEDRRQRATVIAEALMERGDAAAFVLARNILAELEG